ncbi:MAG: TolC family protein [Thermoanaerobaculia bacterium]
MKTAIVLVAGALAAPALSALGQGPARVTLGEALRVARENNPDFLGARADLESARAQRETAAVLPNPVLSYSTAKIPTDGIPAGTVWGNDFYSRGYDTVVSASQLVEIGGKRSSRRASADAGIAAADARLAEAGRLLDAAVVKAYVSAAVAEKSAALSRESADAFERTAAIAREREAAGDVSAAERAQVEIAAGKFLADAAQTDLAAANAARALAALLNRPAVGLAEDLDTLVSAGANPVSLADDGAVLARRPDVLALDAAVRRADADLALQKAFRAPDPTLQFQYERQPPDQRNTVGFGVSLPVPLFNRNTGAIRVASVAAESARRDLLRGRIRVEQDLAATRQALEVAAARAARLSGALVPKATSVRDTVRYAYEQGGASLLELLEAERNANELRLAAAAAQGDLAAARADYRAARVAGIFGEPK